METAVEIASEPITQDLAVIDELHELIRPSYEKATTLLARETCFCDTLYTLRGPNDNLVAFFMVAWHQLELDDTSIQAVYLGLSATRQDTKSTGSVRHVYQRFANDARRWEHRTGKELLLWFTTATPSAYYAAQRLFDGLQPRTNGTYTSHGKRVANALRNYVDADRGEHPFVFHGAAPNTLYSDREVERIQRVCDKHNFRLFEDLEINETEGDRLLCICWPSRD